LRFREALRRLSDDTGDDSLDSLIAATTDQVTDEEIADLTRMLANSGDMLSSPHGTIAADVASTGGPASLSTLLCPLYLRCMGAIVPKVGVPGRPAGGIDVMAQIPGYQVRIPIDRAKAILTDNGYVHVLAAGRFSPLDGQLFLRRQSRNALAVQPLVIASLLSKKLAVGLTHIGLDVRVSQNGNFGRTWDEARTNARRFIRIAAILGIRAKCFLTEGGDAPQPYIGRGEALLALSRLFVGMCDPWLSQHAKRCYAMAAATIGRIDDQMPSNAEIASQFEAHLIAQGSTMEAFELSAKAVASAVRTTLSAHRSGFVEIDLSVLRSAIVKANQRTLFPAAEFPDASGVVLACPPNQFVLAGESIAEIRCPDAHRPELCSAFRIVPGGSQKHGYEEV
jgi:thymidine phosphorylase